MVKYLVELSNSRGVSSQVNGLEKFKKLERVLQMIEQKTKDAEEIMVRLKQKIEECGGGLKRMENASTPEDREVTLLKKKMGLFENKLRQLEEEKALAAQHDHSDVLKDKILLMEDKLRKMERRKSVSLTSVRAQQQARLEEERTATTDPIKLQALEKKLLEMENCNVQVNDLETRALRSTITKLESEWQRAENKIQEDVQRMELERRLAQKKRAEEEEENRARAKKYDEIFIQRMQRMEDKVKVKDSETSSVRGMFIFIFFHSSF
jgi:hypothetical protein